MEKVHEPDGFKFVGIDKNGVAVFESAPTKKRKRDLGSRATFLLETEDNNNGKDR